MAYDLSASENPAVGPINWSNFYPSNHPILRLNRTQHLAVARPRPGGSETDDDALAAAPTGVATLLVLLLLLVLCCCVLLLVAAACAACGREGRAVQRQQAAETE